MTNPDNVGGLVWYVCTSCLLMVQLPSDTPTLGRCQCSPKGWSLRRAKLPSGYELCRAAPAGGDGDWYTSDQGSHIVDFDQDSANQLSILLKRDGTVSAVTTRDGKRSVGGYGLHEVADVIRQWSAPAGSGEVLPNGSATLLRAMVRNYRDGHRWDHLDAKACTDAADLIDALLRKLQQGADYVVVPRIRFEALEASNAEYNAWLDEYHGGGDFTDFLHRYIASQQKEGSS